MNLSDRRVVEFRQWAEKRFSIGSGGYGENEDLLSIVMKTVDDLLGVTSQGHCATRAKELAAKPWEDPVLLERMREAVDGANS